MRSGWVSGAAGGALGLGAAAWTLSGVWHPLAAAGAFAAVGLASIWSGWRARAASHGAARSAGLIRDESAPLVAAAARMASAIRALTAGMQTQASALQETSTAMEQVSSVTRATAENAGQTASVMQAIDAQLDSSNTLLGAMIESMTGIQESSTKIGRIIRTINEIALQTNMLALNAAVEAARAGDAGLGFAVVAGEVRGLALRATQAAKDTETLIEEAEANATAGSNRILELASAICEVTSSMDTMKNLVQAVSTASTQQASGIQQVAGAIVSMEQVNRRTAAAVAEADGVGAELDALSRETHDLAAAFALGQAKDTTQPLRPDESMPAPNNSRRAA